MKTQPNRFLSKIAFILFFAFISQSSDSLAATKSGFDNFDYTSFTLSGLNDLYAKPVCIGLQCFDAHQELALILSKTSREGYYGLEIRNKTISNSVSQVALNTGAFNFFGGVTQGLGEQIDIRAGIKFGTSGAMEYCNAQTIACTDNFSLNYGGNAGLSVWLDQYKIFAGHFDWAREYINDMGASNGGFGKVEKTLSKVGISCYITAKHELSAIYTTTRYKATDTLGTLYFNSLEGATYSYSFHFDN